MHAFVIAGTQSGVGKTTISLAIMTYFKEQGWAVQPYKVGPDFIDPGLHRLVTGRASRNLDGWMLTRAYNTTLFRRTIQGADVAVVEGVMGMYDGYDGASEAGSTAEMAKWLDLPVVLVVDARRMARSVAALVHGFTTFDPNVRWAGVIFNRVSNQAHYAYLQEALSSYLPHIPVLGWIPHEEEISLPERHLGLITAEECALDERWRQTAARLIAHHLHLPSLLERSRHIHTYQMPVPPLRRNPPLPLPSNEDRSPLIAVARDSAFCFSYQDNLDLLTEAGADIAFFSPLKGETIPAEATALILNGGYPELHLPALSDNRRFFDNLRSFVRRGLPVYAECGGLMVLSRFIEDWEERSWPMAGILPFGTRMLRRRRALGYVEVNITKDCLLGPRGTVVRGHEFHYSDIVADGGGEASRETVYRLSPRRGHQGRDEGYRCGSALASYVHQHWGSNPHVPFHLVASLRGGNR